MERLAELKLADLNAEQKKSFEHLRTVISQSGLGGPFSVWLRMPGIGPAIVDLFVVMRQRAILDRRLFELMTLVVIRRWSAQFAWWAHGPRAKQLGISPEAIEAIRTNNPTTGLLRRDEEVVRDVTTELIDRHVLSDGTYARAKATLGELVLIELITSIGFYNMVGITLRSFEVPTPDGSRPLN